MGTAKKTEQDKTPEAAAKPATPAAEPPAGTPTDGGEHRLVTPAAPRDDDGGHPLKTPSGAPPIANVAAPLAAPPRRGPGGEPIAQHVAVGAVLDERHIGIVDEDGKPVDLATALVRGTEVGSIRYANQRIYEETTLPGTDRTRRKLLFGQNATVPEHVYEELCATVSATKTSRTGT